MPVQIKMIVDITKINTNKRLNTNASANIIKKPSNKNISMGAVSKSNKGNMSLFDISKAKKGCKSCGGG